MAALAVTWIAHRWLPQISGWNIFHLNFAAFCIAASVHLFLSFRHACPQCGKHPTIQRFKPPHPNSLTQSKVSGWGGVVVNILRRRRLVCIHCGAEYRIE
ncbi:MAG: hypothetical protein ACK58U_09985 [Rubrivivax sp.]|jgi:hypothetical protein